MSQEIRVSVGTLVHCFYSDDREYRLALADPSKPRGAQVHSAIGRALTASRSEVARLGQMFDARDFEMKKVGGPAFRFRVGEDKKIDVINHFGSSYVPLAKRELLIELRQKFGMSLPAAWLSFSLEFQKIKLQPPSAEREANEIENVRIFYMWHVGVSKKFEAMLRLIQGVAVLTPEEIASTKGGRRRGLTAGKIIGDNVM